MRGYCKCDLCGNIYHKDDNKMYDGITVWWKNKAGENKFPVSDAKLYTQSCEMIDDMPAVMDVCPNCFERLYNWIRMNRNNSDFPMNPPE